jgi:hypothetical protein
MAEKKDSYIEDVNMSNADNGVIISYCERTKSAGKGSYDCYDYNRRQEVFDVDDNDEDDGEMAKAFDRYKELFMEERNYKLKKK